MNSRQNVIHFVDDDASFRKAMYRLRHASGYRLVLHESGVQALETISNGDRGYILLDVQMSGLNGIELQERLENAGNALPIVFISGQSLWSGRSWLSQQADRSPTRYCRAHGQGTPP